MQPLTDFSTTGSGTIGGLLQSAQVPFELLFEHEVSAPLETTFAFHEDPANLEQLLTMENGFRLLHHDGSNRPGTETWFEVTVAGSIPVVLGFKHTQYEPPHRFAETLVHGPFNFFEHRHEFAPVGGGTLVRDVIRIMLPWYYGGSVITRLYVARIMRRLFDCRHGNLTQWRVMNAEPSGSEGPTTWK
jgi:ligand-binding SRPBCC domain-containing protein